MKRVRTYLWALVLGLACVAALAGQTARAESLDQTRDKLEGAQVHLDRRRRPLPGGTGTH